MASVVLLVVVGLAVALYDGLPLVRQRRWKDLALAMTLLVIGLVLATLKALHLIR